MSKHSKWAKIKRKKGVTDQKKGAAFTKLTNNVTLATRDGGGGDPSMNFKLRLAIDAARAANVPNDNIERAIARGIGKGDSAQLEQLLYEGYGPVGTAVLLEATTDSRNRTVSEVKHCFNLYGGNMGASNSVAWMFDRKGVIRVSKAQVASRSWDELELQLIDAGAQDIRTDDEEVITVLGAPTELQKIKIAIEALGLPIDEIGFEWITKTPVLISEPDKQETVANFLGALEDLEDVTAVYTNAIL